MSDDFEELSARARRSALSGAEPAKLEALLEASSEARLWHQAGAEFDAEGAVLPGDHAAAERVARRVIASLPRARARQRVTLLLSAAALLVAFVAAAAALVQRRTVTARPTLTTTARTSAPPLTRASVAPPPEPLATTSAVAAPLVRQAPPPATLATSAMQPVESAASLFSAAAKARREGNADQAITLLDGLQSRYPHSPEAQASDITLGMLQLKRGTASAALPHFQRYLRHSPGAALAPEALWGEAQAFAALGRSADARRAWEELRIRFPDSAYAAAARAQLRSEPPGP